VGFYFPVCCGLADAAGGATGFGFCEEALVKLRKFRPIRIDTGPDFSFVNCSGFVAYTVDVILPIGVLLLVGLLWFGRCLGLFVFGLGFLLVVRGRNRLPHRV
jgi:hypothetical protein